MIRVCIEGRQDDALSRVVVSADSISQALSVAKGHAPNRDARVVFPIDADEFFRREKVEVEVDQHDPLAHRVFERT